MNLDGETSDPNLAGVFGKNTGNGGVGVAGVSDSGDGVRAVSTSGNGLSAFTSSGNNTAVFGKNSGQGGVGVTGISDSGDGVRAVSTSGNGVSAFGGGDQGVGIFAQSSAKRNTGKNTIAGFFDGDVVVSGDVQLTGADCAEDFDVSGTETILPGTVMVINTEGSLQPSDQAYDKKVAGVISGAGNYKPGLVLDKQPSRNGRMPIALTGKVYCKVDAQYSAVEVGDLLTTSPTSGHAMKADEPLKAFGAVIGKALRRLEAGQGMIPILVALQ